MFVWYECSERSIRFDTISRFSTDFYSQTHLHQTVLTCEFGNNPHAILRARSMLATRINDVFVRVVCGVIYGCCCIHSLLAARSNDADAELAEQPRPYRVVQLKFHSIRHLFVYVIYIQLCCHDHNHSYLHKYLYICNSVRTNGLNAT